MTNTEEITEEVKAKRLDTIRKLLAKAEARGVTNEERDAYQNKAIELMAKWSVSDAMIGKVDPAKITYVIHATTGPKIYQREYVLMGIKIAKAFHVKGIISSYGNEDKLGLVGFDDDMDRALLIWRSLEVQLSMALAVAIQQNKWWGGMKASEKFNFKRSFILGFGQEVGDRLQRIHAEAVEVETSATPGSALVLVDRQAAVDKWLSENLSLKTAKSRQYDGGGHSAGRTAGAKANVGQSGMTQGTGQHALGS